MCFPLSVAFYLRSFLANVFFFREDLAWVQMVSRCVDGLSDRAIDALLNPKTKISGDHAYLFFSQVMQEN